MLKRLFVLSICHILRCFELYAWGFKKPQLLSLVPSQLIFSFFSFPPCPPTIFFFFFLTALIDIYEFDGQLTRFIKKINYSATRQTIFLHISLLQCTPVILMRQFFWAGKSHSTTHSITLRYFYNVTVFCYDPC